MLNNLNDGQVHSQQEIFENGIEESAEEFAEGSIALKKALLDLWNIGLNTRACCKGTIEKNHKSDFSVLRIPYIALSVDERNVKQVVRYIGYLIDEQSKRKPTIALKMYNDRNVGKPLVLNRIFLTNKATSKMFESISHASERMNNNEHIEESELLQNIGKVFEQISKSEGLNANELVVKIKRDKAKLSINTYENKFIVLQITNKNMDRVFETLDNYLYIPYFQRAKNEINDQISNFGEDSKEQDKKIEQTKENNEELEF